MLTIEQVRTHGKCQEEWEKPRNKIRCRAQVFVDENTYGDVKYQGKQRIQMFGWALYKRLNIQPVNKKCKVSEDNGEWMPVDQISEAFGFC
jgi:hypothetical protein